MIYHRYRSGFMAGKQPMNQTTGVQQRLPWPRIPLLLALPLLLAACPSENRMSSANTPADAQASDGQQPQARTHDHPRQAVELLLTLDNPPGPFAVVEGVAQYDVVNEEQCGHINPLSGTAERITHQQAIALQAVGGNRYRATLYRDLMRDEDYYGRGVCQWQFSGAGALLKASGADGETRFTAFIDAQAIDQGHSATRHYPAADYPRVPGMDDYGQAGKADADSYVPALRAQLFTATLQANKAGQ